MMLLRTTEGNWRGRGYLLKSRACYAALFQLGQTPVKTRTVSIEFLTIGKARDR
jgi:hypothetical protein